MKNPLEKLSKNTRGATNISGVVIGVVVALIIAIVMLVVGLYVVGQLSTLSSTINYGSAANNATATSVFTAAFGAFSLLSILPYILGAGALITAIVVVLAVTYSRR